MICRGILASLSALYQHLLQLLGEVADAHPMPFLTEFSLPVDMSQFLPPSDAFLQISHIPQRKTQQEVQQRVKRKLKEDLGVAINRGTVFRKTPPLYTSMKIKTTVYNGLNFLF